MLTVTPIDLAEANAFVALHHRHHVPALGHKFSVAVSDEAGQVRGVAIVSRPIARGNDNGWTVEVTRLCTDGAPNACSMLYAAAWRAAKALGYRRLVTYTLPEEGGASLRAAGLRCLGERGGGSWSVPSRPRVDKHPLQTKLAWEYVA
jgi:L-amino acid N-acyltransferase YncA